MKYREFRYKCGARGSYCEEYAIDPTTLDYEYEPFFVSPVEWGKACRYAMDTFVLANRLAGKVSFNGRLE
jgi:hypothetical protein